MTPTEIIPAPDVAPRAAIEDATWRHEHDAFLRKFPELLENYDGQFVAIHDGEVIAAGINETEVIQAAYDRVGYVTLHVERVSLESPYVYQFRTPRISPNLH